MANNDSICSSVSSGSSSGEGDSIRVFVRVRPLATETTDVDHGTCVDVDGTRIIMRAKPEAKIFPFDEVADQNATQEGIFCSVGKRIVDSCVGGYNGTIFAYGQTGSGKTFTMLGPHEDSNCFQHELRGVIPRSFEYLFKLMTKEQDLNGDKLTFLTKCSFLEIYNEQVFDLLDTTAASVLSLRENIKRGIYVEGLMEVAVTSAAEAYQVLNRGWVNRTVASTTMNRESSRSHAVFTVHIESKVNNGGVFKIRSSQLHLVDLAGSERQKDTHTTGVRLKEAGSINRSLSALGNVIKALVDVAHGKSRHVPYRDSKLSFLLRDSLGGNSRTCVVACVHPGSKCFGETMSTLQFARRAKMIKNKAIVNEDLQGSVTQLQAEIKKLKEIIVSLHQAPPTVPGDRQRVLSASADGSGDSTCSMQYKQFFLQAMLLRQRADDDKKLLTQKLDGLKELCDRKDKALSQNKMVLKFREEALHRCEKALKEKVSLTTDDKDAIIESHRAEIRALEAIVSRHPDEVKYRMENDGLRTEVQRLRTQLAKSGEPDLTKMAGELERSFIELRDSEIKADVETSSKSSSSSETTAALERYKSQIEKLENDLETLKGDSAAENQKLQKQLIDREAELVAVSRGKEELERILKAHQVRNQIERETRDDLHNETIKIMTTPKKGIVPRSSSRFGLALPLNNNQLMSTPPQAVTSSVSPEHPSIPSVDLELITSESPPARLAEEQIEGLREEVSRLQDQIRELRNSLEESDRAMVEHVQNKLRLETQHKLTQQMLEREQERWKATESELQQRINLLSKENVALAEVNRLTSSELHDLRIMNTAADRQLNEIRSELRSGKSSTEKEVGRLETELLKLTVERNELQQSLDLASEEREQLQESEENLQATLDYTSDNLKATEDQLTVAKQELKKLNSQIETMKTRIDNLEKEKVVLSQLQQEKGVKETELLQALQTIESLRETVRNETAAADEHLVEVKNLTQKLVEARSEIDRHVMVAASREQSIGTLTQSVAELKETVAQCTATIGDLTGRLEDASHEVLQQKSTVKSLESRLSAQISEHQNEIGRLQQQISGRNAEIDMLKEDFQEAEDRANIFKNQLLVETEQTKELTVSNEKLRSEIEQQKVEIGKLQETIETMSQDNQEPILAARCETLLGQLNKLQSAFDVVSSQLNATNDGASRTQCELVEAKAAASRLAADHSELASRFATLQVEIDLYRQQAEEREEDLKNQIQSLKDISYHSELEFNAALAVAKSAAENDMQLRATILKLCKEIESFKAREAEFDQETDRLKGSLTAAHAQSASHSSEIERLKEENKRLATRAAKLDTDLEQQLSENAKLSGHHNTSQRICYLEKLKEQLLRTEKYNQLLVSEYEKARLAAQISGGVYLPPLPPMNGF